MKRDVDKIMNETSHAMNIALELFNWDEKEMQNWFNTYNKQFNERPLEVCMRGDSYIVIQHIKLLLRSKIK